MNGRVIWGVFLTLVLVVIALSIGVYVYNVGVAQGLAQSGRLPAPESGTVPNPYYGYGPFLHRPFGFGFGLFGLLVPLFFFFLILAVLRGLFWGGHRGWHRHHGMTENGVPPMFDEWHRRMHEPKGSG